jgi:diguanylate cyclase (GGDEF)-like protein/PAS domain S-box-containing protein
VALTLPTPQAAPEAAAFEAAGAEAAPTGHATPAPDAARRFWRHLGLACVLASVAVLSNAYDALAGPGAPTQRVSPLTTGLYIAGVCVALWAFIRLPIARRTGGPAFTLGLDAGIVLLSAALLAWYFAVHETVARMASLDTRVQVLSTVLFGFAGVLAVVKVALAGTRTLDRPVLWALGAAVLAGALTGGLAAAMRSRPDLNDAQLSLPLTAFGIVWAAHLYRTGVVRRVGGARSRWPFSPVPYVAIAVVDALLIVAAHDSDRLVWVTAVGSVVLTSLVVVRQLAAFFDNAKLLRQVDTSMLELRRHEQRFRSLVQNSSDLIMILNPDGELTYVSPGLRRVLGTDPAVWLGRGVGQYVHPDDRAAVRELFGQMASEPNATVTCQARLAHAEGSWRWLDLSFTNLLHDPAVRGIVTNGRDITETRRYADQLAYQALHDELTGLGNRTLFTRRTARALADAKGPGTVAVVLVDLDDFKAINDRLGHAVGDALLVAMSTRLRGCTRPGDMVARLGGDEFAVLLHDLRPGESSQIADRIMAALDAPLRAAGHDLLAQASIGLSDNEADTGAAELLRRADVAMYSAKDLGKSRYAHYHADLDSRAVEHAQLAAELRRALDRNELYLLYQPIVALPHGELAGVEALVRWNHPEHGFVSPVRFIPVAERTGVIVALGAWVLETACRQAAAWLAEHGDLAPKTTSVNVSARQLLEPCFPQFVAKVLASTGLPPHRLTVEITETAVFGGGRAVDAVATLHEMGVNIALDDFGTGHSSLGLLRTCPVDVLKVDKSFIDGVTGTVEQEAIATSVSEIAQALRLRAIAEGVESAAQAQRLHALGYRLAQGFHFARPMPAQEVEPMFALPAGLGLAATRDIAAA